MAPFATNAFAATEPDTTPNSDAPIYLLNNDTSTQYAKGIQLDWGQASGVIASSIPIPTIPTNWDTLRLPAPTLSETKAIAFIAPIGGEKSRSQWKAYGDDLDVDSNGLLMPMITPEFLGKGTPAAVKSAGGNWSLGVAYLAPGNPSTAAPTKAYFTTINVDPGTGTWKFYDWGTTTTPTSTTTTLAVDPISLSVGGNVTLTATVAMGGSTTAAGSVEFYDGTTSLGTATVASGTATKSVTVSSAGTHSFKATFTPSDSGYSASMSSVVSVTATKVATTTALVTSATSVTSGASVTLTATVAPSSVAGTVQFFDCSTALGSVALSGGTAAKTVTVATGNHSYTARFAGDSAYAASSSTAVAVTAATPAKPATTTTLTLPASANAGASVSMSASVAPAAATGTVAFMEGLTTLGTGTLSGGTATFSTSVLAVGTHTITAAYSGDATYAASTSAASTVTVTVTNPAPMLRKFTKTYKPTISGKAKVGKKLSVKVKVWSPVATFKYQWLANGKSIKGATKSTYKLTKSQKGKKVTVKLTGSRAGYASVVLTSAATKKVS